MAKQIIGMDISVPQKIVGILASMKPTEEEQPVKNTLFQPENVLMHYKVRQKLINVLTPLLSEVIGEGVNEGIFECENIPERVKMLLIISDSTFNEGTFTEKDVSVFIDMTEKRLGAENGTMSFIYDMIDIMAMSLGVVVNEGDVYDRYDDLRTCLTTMEKYESTRLRS